ncbi:MAG: hypothetical protein M3N24_10475, partial [Actinomycetota bacterium]|nr:hypothetical protein [Actinomycetota bacterium]
MVIQSAEQPFGPQEVRIEAPKEDGRYDSADYQQPIARTQAKPSESSGHSNCPSLDEERVSRQSSDNALNHLEVLQLVSVERLIAAHDKSLAEVSGLGEVQASSPRSRSHP